MPDPTSVPTASRPVRSTPYPKLSVIVVLSSGTGFLDRFLEALVPQAVRHSAEIVIAHSHDGEISDHKGQFPGVSFVELPDGSGTARLRAGGVAASDGDVVVITETSEGLLPPDWLDRLVRRSSMASRRPNT